MKVFARFTPVLLTVWFLSAPLARSQEDALRTAVRAKIAELEAAEHAAMFPPTLDPQLEPRLRQALRERMAALDAEGAGAARSGDAAPQPAKAQPVAATSAPAPAPAPAVPEPFDLSQLPQDKGERLKELTRLYKADMISPRVYHLERARLVGQR